MFLERVGCFYVASKRILVYRHPPLEIVKACGSLAWSRGLKAFAVRNGSECLGDKYLPSLLPRLNAMAGCLGGRGGQNMTDVYRFTCKKALPFSVWEILVLFYRFVNCSSRVHLLLVWLIHTHALTNLSFGVSSDHRCSCLLTLCLPRYQKVS